jgi:PTH1 family peptidyl-tRNA hydrolase
MSLLRRNPFADSERMPYYTLGLTKTVLVVGLGNVGKKYEKTRHNVGFTALDTFVEKNDGSWTLKKDLRSLVSQVNIGATKVILCKPTTMMNNSGEAVQAVMNFYKIPATEVVVVHDELDISFGQIRCRKGGSAAGNNGIKSIIQHIGEDFERMRIGIGPKLPEQMDSADFVLANFSPAHAKHMDSLKRESVALLTERIASGQLPHDTINFIV